MAFKHKHLPAVGMPVSDDVSRRPVDQTSSEGNEKVSSGSVGS
jgi:hypothetical protein